MEKVNALKETIAVFVKCVEDVRRITDSRELDAIERKAVTALQLAEVQIADAGDDLYHAVLDQRRKINNGEVVKEEEVETKDGPSDDSAEAKTSKPRRAKRQTKKSAK